MRQEDILKEKYGKDPGFRVPDGYFDDLNKKIMASLPPYKVAPVMPVMSRWQRVKPYVYLAAMFAGIWVMMKVFHNVSGGGRLTLDNPPQAIVQLIEEGQYPDYYDSYIDEPDFILEEEVSSSYDSIEDFEEDFGYKLSPEYSNIKILPEIPTDKNV